MSFRRLVTAVTFIALFAMAMRVSVDTDTWWHLRAGAWISENRQLLTTDPFSLTRYGEPWIYPGWLSQIVLYQVYRIGGLPGLNLLTAAMVLLAFWFVRREMDSPLLLRGFVVLLAAAASAIYWSARPQIFSFALSGAFVWSLERFRSGHKGSLWLLPPLMALWGNLHGGFAIGFLLMFAYLAGEVAEWLTLVIKGRGRQDLLGHLRSRALPLVLATAASALALALNPHGFRMLVYPLKTVSIGVLQDYIQEWQSPDFHTAETQPFLWLLLLTFCVMALRRTRLYATDLILVAGFSYLGFLAGRNIATFALVSAPVLARHAHAVLEPWLARRPEANQVPPRLARWLNLLILVIAGGLAAIKVAEPLSSSKTWKAVGEILPVQAVSFIREHEPVGPLFNSYNWGGYVLWALYPEYRSFVDGRTDLFDNQLLTEYVRAWRGDPGWEQTFARWDISLALLEADAPLSRELERAGWKKLFSDDKAMVLSKGGSH